MYIPDLIGREGLRRGLSIETIKTYKQCIKQFFRYCDKDPRYVKKSDIGNYIDKLIEKKASNNTLNVHLCALKFFYNQILKKRLLLRIRFSRTPKQLPTVLAKEEVLRLLNAIKNPKHWLIIALMYSAGLRVGEVVKLKAGDLDFIRNMGWVRQGKGNKDRPFIIADKLKVILKNHIKHLYPHSYLFTGQKGHITSMSIQRIVKRAAKKAKIKKNVHPHTLRHSFATHLIENNYDITAVQTLLGHSSLETTNMYLHVASPVIRVKSPLDG